jgi:hypothetical protein
VFDGRILLLASLSTLWCFSQHLQVEYSYGCCPLSATVARLRSVDATGFCGAAIEANDVGEAALHRCA